MVFSLSGAVSSKNIERSKLQIGINKVLQDM